MSSIAKFTFLRGHWLFDAGSDFYLYVFDISRPECYPPEIKSCVSSSLEEAVYRFRHPDSLDRENFSDYKVANNDTKSLNRLHNIVACLRENVARKYRLQNIMPLPSRSVPLLSSTPLPKDSARLIPLYIARSVVFEGRSIDSLAESFQVSKTNIRIWVSIYLTHGSQVFYLKERELDPIGEAVLVHNHIHTGKSVVLTCSSFCIFDKKRLQRIIRRQRLNPALPNLF